jgi:type IV pilus assembly protein PilQ
MSLTPVEVDIMRGKHTLGLLLIIVLLFANCLPATAQRSRARDGLISMNIEGAEIRSVLRTFSEFSGMNIIAGSDVKGTVTVLLHNVPWRQALDNVLKINDFVAVEEEGIIRIVTLNDIQNAEKMIELQTNVYPVNFARAEQLKGIVDKMLTDRGMCQHDIRTNTLVVTDIPRVLGSVDFLVDTLDLQMDQVMIYAKIAEVDTRVRREIGIDWTAGNLENPLSPTQIQGEVQLTPADYTGRFSFGRIQEGVNLSAVIDALEEDDRANILSQPSVLIADNEQAVILSGKKIPITTLDRSGNLITTFYDVAVKLTVTPHINPNKQIMLELTPEVSDLSSEATVSGGIIILTSSVTTKLLVNNGDTAVIGGVIRSKKSSLDRRVPLLHAIPLLGHLFQYSSTSTDNTEIMIFVTPKIIPVELATTEPSNIKLPTMTK